MQIKAKATLKNLIGQNLIGEGNKPLTMGEVLSNILLNDRVGSKMKCYILAEKFFKDETVEIDEADLSLVKDSIQRTELYNNLVNGQLLILIGK